MPRIARSVSKDRAAFSIEGALVGGPTETTDQTQVGEVGLNGLFQFPIRHIAPIIQQTCSETILDRWMPSNGHNTEDCLNLGLPPPSRGVDLRAANFGSGLRFPYIPSVGTNLDFFVQPIVNVGRYLSR